MKSIGFAGRPEREQTAGRHEAIAARDEFGDLVPIDGAAVQTERDPASGSDVGGKVKVLRLGRRKRGVIARQSFRRNRDDTVAVMGVEEVGEGFLPDHEDGMFAAVPARGFGKREAYFRKDA
jgi:hypothetical protein